MALDTPALFKAVHDALHPMGGMTVLDLGSSHRPQRIVVASRHVCVDPCAEALLKITLPTVETWHMTAIEALDLVEPGDFDAVVMLDMIEHLEKDDGRALLKRALWAAGRLVVVFTPLWFCPQEPCEPGGEWQRHRSGWTPEDFGEGWEFFHGEHRDGCDPEHGRKDVVPAFFAIWKRPA